MNMQQIMQQAQKMQKDILAKKDEIDKKEFIGKSGWVEISLTGDKQVKKVNIVNDDAFSSDNKEIFEDMIMIAINDGIEKINKETEEKLGSYSKFGGLF